MYVPEPLRKRNLGHYPVTFSTSSALQRVFNEHPDYAVKEGELPLSKSHDILAINVQTLLRNLLGSIESQYSHLASTEVLATLVFEEMNVISELVKAKSDNKLKVVYYTGLYSNPRLLFPKMTSIKPKTGKTQARQMLSNETISILISPESEWNKLEVNRHLKVKFSDNEPPLLSNNPFAKILLITHLPTDVLFVGNAQVKIVESHTGAVKSLSELNTKLKGKPERIPFNKITVSIMGDTGGVVDPAHVKDRRLLAEFAEANQWEAYLTYETIKQSLLDKAPELLQQYVY